MKKLLKKVLRILQSFKLKLKFCSCKNKKRPTLYLALALFCSLSFVLFYELQSMYRSISRSKMILWWYISPTFPPLAIMQFSFFRSSSIWFFNCSFWFILVCPFLCVFCLRYSLILSFIICALHFFNNG
jgi:hypothetical protein